jgi:hypothetical protein
MGRILWGYDNMKELRFENGDTIPNIKNYFIK